MSRKFLIRKIALQSVVKTNGLNDAFFIKLKEIAQRHGMNPADLLLVMYSESGVNPSAINKDGGAVGIGQFMPFILKNLGWTRGPEEFSKLPAETQLDYMEKLIESNIKTNGGKPFKSATQYYQSHFLPASLARGTALDTIIADGRPGMAKAKWEKPAYDHNSSFDQDKKGYITVGDLDKWLNKKRNEAGFKNLLSKLNSVNGISEYMSSYEDYKSYSKPYENDIIGEFENSLDYLNKYLNNVFATSNIKIKK